MRSTIGIDISKDTLDAHRLDSGETIQVRNDTPLLGGYDEPETLPCSIWAICLIGADAGHQ